MPIIPGHGLDTCLLGRELIETYMIKNTAIMNYLIKILSSRTDRMGYLISILVVVVGFYFYDFYFMSDRCYVCQPPELFPWEEILMLSVGSSLGGGYLCILLCWGAFKTSWVGASITIPILLTAFFYLQTIRRCHDIGYSGWRSLIPVYTPLFLFFITGKNENEEHIGKSSIVTLLLQNKWQILLMIVICLLYYMIRISFVHMHNAL